MLLPYILNNWKYSAAPEGQQPFEKVLGLCKYGFCTSALIGVYDCAAISQTLTLWETVNTMSYWVVPITAMCATFASVAYTVTKIRGKDGYANYFLASLATGGVFYQWQKCGIKAHNFTIALLVCAMLKKHSDFDGWQPFALNSQVFSQYTTFPIDFTITKDPRGPRAWE